LTENRYPLATSTWDDDEYRALQRVIESGQFTMGTEVQSFEQELAHYFGSKYCVMFNSGSSANLAALTAVKFRAQLIHDDRDEVIVPMVSWSTTFYPVNQAGFKLRFVDVDLHDLNLSLSAVESAIGPKTIGVLAVNLLGNPSQLEAIKRLCDVNDMFLVEDNCESMGASIRDKYCGTFGEIGTFSTYFSHHISTMEGGFCTTNDPDLYEFLLAIRAHGWTRNLPSSSKLRPSNNDEWENLFTFVMPGFNLRPLELEAAVGREQLKKLPSIITGRKTNAEVFLELFSGYEELVLQREHGSSSWFGFSLILSSKHFDRLARKQLVTELGISGIESRPIVTGNFLRQPVIKHLNHAEHGSSENADMVHDYGLFVGNHHYDISTELELLHLTVRSFIEDHSSREF